MGKFFIVCTFGALSLAGPAQGQEAPLTDHHQHLLSPALAELISPPGGPPTIPITARDLVMHLDAAGIRSALVLSTAYIWSQPSRRVENEYERVKAENDWTSQQVAMFPDRLNGFCGLNPIKEYALTELARCAKDPYLRHGLKLHFGNSAVDYRNVKHVKLLKSVFRAANDFRMPIVVHMRASITEKLGYGREEALVFLNEVIPAAPAVPIQIAHLAGAGGYSDPAVDQALSVFIDAIRAGDTRTKQLWFDVTSVALGTPTPEQAQLIANRIRQIGLQRVIYGSDAAISNNSPREAWAAFRRLPLTPEEFRAIARNVAPYARAAP
jgi:uncharacterized protein